MKMTTRRLLIGALALSLAACSTTGTPTEVRYQTVTVTKRGPCPAESVFASLTASRPTPLRNQARPVSGVERGARTSAQLALFEREGGWADKVVAALTRCQAVSQDSETAEGVASSP